MTAENFNFYKNFQSNWTISNNYSAVKVRESLAFSYVHDNINYVRLLWSSLLAENLTSQENEKNIGQANILMVAWKL